MLSFDHILKIKMSKNPNCNGKSRKSKLYYERFFLNFQNQYVVSPKRGLYVSNFVRIGLSIIIVTSIVIVEDFN